MAPKWDIEVPQERFDKFYKRWWVLHQRPGFAAGYILRSHWVWLHTVGDYPPLGMVVHHIDENQENDDPSNLELLTRAEHCRLHRPGDNIPYEEKRRMMLEARVKWQEIYGVKQ